MELLKYQRLGSLTFWVFVIRSLLPALMGFIFLFFFLVLKVAGLPSILAGAPNGTEDIAHSVDSFINWGILGSFALFAIGTALAFILGVIDYYSYNFILDTHDLRIRRGFINIDESAIPYQHIEDVAIERPLIYRLLGVSTLVIYTAANASHEADDTESILPAIPRRLADEIREEIMKRANLQDLGNRSNP